MPSTWLISGTSSGIGRSLTERLLEQGHRVAATLRTPSALEDLADRHGDLLWRAALDVTEPQAVRDVVDEAFDHHGRIDVAVSNAGWAAFGAAEEQSEEQIRRQVETNLLGSVHFIRALVPHMRRQGGGRVLQVSSQGGQCAEPPGTSIYHATKWGIEGFIETLALEVGRFGIVPTIIEPGASRTSFFDKLDRAPAMPVYENIIPAMIRAPTDVPMVDIPGDPGRMAQAIVTIAEMHDPPLRQPLGSDAYRNVTQALHDRVQALGATRELALSTDSTDYHSG